MHAELVLAEAVQAVPRRVAPERSSVFFVLLAQLKLELLELLLDEFLRVARAVRDVPIRSKGANSRAKVSLSLDIGMYGTYR